MDTNTHTTKTHGTGITSDNRIPAANASAPPYGNSSASQSSVSNIFIKN